MIAFYVSDPVSILMQGFLAGVAFVFLWLALMIRVMKKSAERNREKEAEFKAECARAWAEAKVPNPERGES